MKWVLCFPSDKSIREAGAGLVDVLMTLALLAIGSVIVMNMISNVSKTRRAVELKAEATLLKKTLLTATDCRALAACQGQELRSLVDYDGDVLVNSSGTTKAGPWSVQARCLPNKSLEVRVALLDANGQAVKDPLRGKLMDWNAPEGILIESGILCGVINKSASGQPFTVKLGNLCTPSQGSCPPPPESVIDPKVGPTMCCEDGRDSPKPSCPTKTQEFASYWDRQDDWGKSGQWIVLCQ